MDKKFTFDVINSDVGKARFAIDTGIHTWVIDHTNMVIHLPESLVEYLGYDSLEDMLAHALVDHDEMMDMGRKIRETADEVPVLGSLHLFPKDSDDIATLNYMGGSHTNNHGVRKTIGLLLDIEHRSQIEARLKHVDKRMLVGQMFGGVAHDIKNQIMTIDAAITMIDRYCDDQRVLKYLRSIEEAVENSTFLLQHLTKFAGNNRHDLRIMNINELVARAVAILTQTVKGEYSFKAYYNAPHDTILGEEHLLDNVLLNIALNARDAMPRGGTIEFTTYNQDENPKSNKEHKGWVCLSIKDNGVGMDAATMRRIFEPYFSTKPVGSGAGMGLALCLSTVHSHEGTIDVESKVGEGTEFILSFPITKQESRVIVQKPKDIKGQVLVLETDPSVRLILRSIIKELGYKVKAFNKQSDMCTYINESMETSKAAIINIDLDDVKCPNLMRDPNGCMGIKLIPMGESQEMCDLLNVKDSKDRGKLLKIVGELIEG